MTVGVLREYILNIYNENNEAPFFLLHPFSSYSILYFTTTTQNMKKGSILSSTKTLLFCSIFLCVVVIAVVHFFLCWYLIHYEILFLTHSLFWDIIIIINAILYCHQSLIIKDVVMLFVCCFTLSIHTTFTHQMP